MKKNRYGYNAFGSECYKANKIQNYFNYHIDYWLIGKGDHYVDAKRILPITFLLTWAFGGAFAYIVGSDMEKVGYILFKSTGPITLVEYIQWKLGHHFADGDYSYLFFGLIIGPLFYLLAFHMLFAPYPRPIRFNRKNGLVYTKQWGRVWVTEWDSAYVTMWRAATLATGWKVGQRGLAIRLHSFDLKGQPIKRWVPMSGLDNMDVVDEQIGGEACILFWHWLNEYMQGATLSGSGSENINNGDNFSVLSADRKIPEPVIGRQWVFEKLMRFRPYKFSKKIDAAAVEAHQKLQSLNAYALKNNERETQIPDSPFFPWKDDYPHLPIPGTEAYDQHIKQMIKEDEKSEAAKETKKLQAIAAKELKKHPKPKNNSEETAPIAKPDYQYFYLAELQAALASDKQRSAEDIALIEHYIKLGGYKAKD